MTRDSAVLDASAFVRAFDGHEAATEWIRRGFVGDVELIAPELILPETASALLRYVRSGLAEVAEMVDALADLRSAVAFVSLALLYPTAFELALERGLSAYDACYVALAESAGAVLVTADRRLAAATGRAELIA